MEVVRQNPSKVTKVGGWLLFFAITLLVINPVMRLVGIVSSFGPVASIAAKYPRFTITFAGVVRVIAGGTFGAEVRMAFSTGRGAEVLNSVLAWHVKIPATAAMMKAAMRVLGREVFMASDSFLSKCVLI